MSEGNPATSNSKLYNAVLDEMYDDACDLGQFFMNPGWYLYSKMALFFQNRHQTHTAELPTASSRKAPQLHRPPVSMGWQYAAYLAVIFVSWAVIFTRLYPMAAANESFPKHHLTFGYVLFLLCVASWRLAGGTSPGTITLESMHRFDNYPYDELLYETGKLCPTLHLRKLARSKYDRYSCTQVPRFDHYCGWIHQTVGEENYRVFVVFLVVHTFMCMYGTVMTFRLLWSEAYFEDRSARGSPLSLTANLLSMALVDLWLTAIMAIMGAVSCVIIPFLAFHLYLIAFGMTTNEFYKWKLIKVRHQKATVDYNNRNVHAVMVMVDDAGINGDARQLYNCTDDPGPFPLNIYDLRCAANIWEVACPRSLRDAQHRKSA